MNKLSKFAICALVMPAGSLLAVGTASANPNADADTDQQREPFEQQSQTGTTDHDSMDPASEGYDAEDQETADRGTTDYGSQEQDTADRGTSEYDSEEPGTADSGMSEYDSQEQDTADSGMSEYDSQEQDTADSGMSEYDSQEQDTADSGTTGYGTDEQDTADRGTSDYGTQDPADKEQGSTVTEQDSMGAEGGHTAATAQHSSDDMSDKMSDKMSGKTKGESYMSSAPTNSINVEKVVGSKLQMSSSDEEVGDIDDLVIDESGKVVAAVVNIGGILGMGQHPIAISWDLIESKMNEGSDGYSFTVDATMDELRDAPTYDQKSTGRRLSSTATE